MVCRIQMFDVWLNSTRLVVGGEGGGEGSGGWFFERKDFNSSSRLKRKGEHGLLLGDARWILEITNNSFLSLEEFLFFAPFKILLSRLRSRRNLIRAPEIISSRQRQMISTDRFSNDDPKLWQRQHHRTILYPRTKTIRFLRRAHLPHDGERAGS